MILKPQKFRLIRESIDSLKHQIELLGYTIKKVSAKNVIVLVDDDRTKALKKIAANTGGDLEPPSRHSSKGSVKVGEWRIIAKPAKKQGSGSAGLDNEHTLMKKIEENAPCNVRFEDERGKVTEYKNIVKVTHSGTDVTGNKKADIVLLTENDRPHPISIKKANAEYWESADKTLGPLVRPLIEEAAAGGEVELKQQEAGHYKIIPEVCFDLTNQKVKEVVFGSDLLGQGCVVKQTFDDEHFTKDGNTLIIKVIALIEDIPDIDPKEYPTVLVRNDMTRNSSGKNIHPGLRILVSYTSRCKKVKKLDAVIGAE